MSWVSNLVETYDKCLDLITLDDKKTLLPTSHMIMKTHVCVTIDGEGRFLKADPPDKKPTPIVIPCTIDSASRTVAISPHPLHEQLGYLALDQVKRSVYLAQIADWSCRNPKIEAVYKYVSGNTLLDDLAKSQIASGDDKLFIRFRVEIPGDLIPDLWKDKEIAEAWRKYYEPKLANEELCFVIGDRLSITDKHPKGTNKNTYGAKLISIPSDRNLITYQGRFTRSEQASSISYLASQKAHAMLRCLLERQGRKCGSQAIAAWEIGANTESADMFEDSFSLFNQSCKTDTANTQVEAENTLGADYGLRLRAALFGYGNEKRLHEHVRNVAVIAVNAATTGRMGITFYQEMQKNEYLERIASWHENCRWHFVFWEKKDGKNERRACISSPGADRIIAAVFGEPKGEGYDKVKSQALERLLHNIFSGEPISRDWMLSVMRRASSPFSYSKQDGGWNKIVWERVFATSCAITKAFYKEKEKEDYKLELETNCNNRSYLYGRLLAIADKIESHARYDQSKGKDDMEKRPTNAVRYMSRFTVKPFDTWHMLYTQQLRPYIQRLNGAYGYQKQIDEIMLLFQMDDFDSGKPLDGRFLMGYSLQRLALFKNDDKEKNENESEQQN